VKVFVAGTVLYKSFSLVATESVSIVKLEYPWLYPMATSWYIIVSSHPVFAATNYSQYGLVATQPGTFCRDSYEVNLDTTW